MKKGIAGILVSAFGLVAIFFVWKLFRTLDPEKLLPVDTIAYARFDFPQSEISNWRRTKLFKEINSSPRRENYERQLRRLLAFVQNASGIDPALFWNQIRQPAVIALVPGSQKGPGIVFICGVVSKENLSILLTENYDAGLKRRIPDLRKSPVNYEGRTYYRYSSTRFGPRWTPGYALEDRYLLVASSEEAMRKLFDVLANKLEPLKKNAQVWQARKAIHYRHGIFVYTDVGKIYELSRKNRASEIRFSLAELAGIQSVRAASYRIGARNDGFEEEAMILGSDHKEGLFKIYLQQRPLNLDGIKAAPNTCDMVHAFSLPDLAGIWKETSRNAEKLLTPSQYQAWQNLTEIFRRLIRFDPESDLLKHVGDQLVYCADFRSAASGKDHFVAVHLKPGYRPAQTLDQWSSLGTLRRQRQNYKGRILTEAGFRLGGFYINFAHYLETPWLHLSNNPELLKKSIDARTDENGIVTVADYKKVTAGFPDKSNSISYSGVSFTLKRYASLLQNSAVSHKIPWISESELEEELSRLSSSLFGTASYTQIEEDGLSYDSFGAVPNAFVALPALLAVMPEIDFHTESEP